MTRFARAKGSKASNEKLPEEPTSWSMMKQQFLEKTRKIEDSQRYSEIKKERNANYQKFLAEREAEETKKVEWADFPGASVKISKNIDKIKKSKNKTEQTATDDYDSDEAFTELKKKVDKVLEEQQADSDSDASPEEHSSKTEVKAPLIPKTKKVKVKKLKILSDIESQVILKKGQTEKHTGGHIKKNKSTGKNSIENNEGETNTVNNLLENDKIISELDLKRIQKKKERRLKQVKKKQELKLQMKNGSIEKNEKDQDKGKLQKSKNEDKKEESKKSNLNEEELKKIQKKKEKKLRQLEKRKLRKKMQKENKDAEEKHLENGLAAMKNVCHKNDALITNNESKDKEIINDFKVGNEANEEKIEKKNNHQECLDNNNTSNTKIVSFKQESSPKKRRNKSSDEHQRKKPYLPEKMWINGEQVEIGYVDGFPIMKKDAERLKQLKKAMVMKGLPGSEIKAALKLERRRAEKALAREKKKVCFNCRKSGHNLSECPDLGKDQIISTAGSGICFKCGSTEHSHLDCKVIKGQSFNYAQCFICNEQGHIARQCPDNPNGLYPKGGGCNVCGDVSHLKKDCPTYQEQQQKQNEGFKLGTLGTSNPDADDYETKNNVQNTNSYRPNKIIKF